MIQLLWDRGEANGYVYHMVRDPLPNTPKKTVLLHEAFGDHQVSNVATETEARIIGARLRTPALDPGAAATAAVLRHQADPELSVEGQRADDLRHRPAAAARAARGAACKGTPPAPVTNTPPDIGVDPHPLTAHRAERGVRVLGLPQGRRRLRGPLRQGQALLRAGLDGAVKRPPRWRAVALRRARPGRAGGRRGLRPDRPVALPLSLAERLLPQARPPRADRGA